ncbi:DUF1294 domain-containing protein [Ruegeria sp. MALMAid1280]|uniref:DUF1294 domain-containing protein n=1 Tax=Ruegeria sp. MALMAid1280 TaxID=3411634 RepID=UPI003BA0FA14
MKIPNLFSFDIAARRGYPSGMWIAVLYLWAINILSLVAFGWDKLRARRRKGRIPERKLLWLAALGGSPGAVMGRWIFNHKTRKRSFSMRLFLIVGFQVVCGFFLVQFAQAN